MTFILTNNLDKKEYTFSVTDENDSKLFYHFNITLGGAMPDGEYTYKLIDENTNIVATGLAQVGDYTPEKITYNKPNDGYIQYD